MQGRGQHLAGFAVVTLTIAFGGLVVTAESTAAMQEDYQAAATRAATRAAPGQTVWRARPVSALPAIDSVPVFQVDFQPVAGAPRLKKYRTTRCKPAETGQWSCSPAVDRWLLGPSTNEGSACSAELDLTRDAVPDRALLEVVDFVQSSSELRDALGRQRCGTARLCDVVAVSARPNERLAVTLGLPDACLEELVLQRNCSGSHCSYDLVECRTLCA
jgi:hypothetical protein